MKRAQRLEHGGAGTPRSSKRLIERRLDDDAGRDLARERLVGEEACLLIGRAEKLLLGDARLIGRHTFGGQAGRHGTEGERSGERRGERGLLLHGLLVCDEITRNASVLSRGSA